MVVKACFSYIDEAMCEIISPPTDFDPTPAPLATWLVDAEGVELTVFTQPVDVLASKTTREQDLLYDHRLHYNASVDKYFYPHFAVMNQKLHKKILNIIDEIGVLRAKDLDAYTIPRSYLQQMVENGLLTRVERGLYMRSDADITEYHTLALASKRVSHGVICLLSALQYHGLTTQLPHQVWMAIHPKDRLPRITHIPIRFVRFSGDALTEGQETYEIEKVSVTITTPAKTVVDCFKYRNKIGIDVAIEALRDCLTRQDALGQRLCSIDEIWRYAAICRVTKVMQPYLEVLT